MIINYLKRKLPPLIQLITRNAMSALQGRICHLCFSRLRMLSPTKRIPRTFHGARHAPWHHRGPLMPSPIKAKCSGKKKHREEAWGQTRKEGTDEGEPRALERISRGKEFRAMLQLMRIKPRRIYHAAGHSLLSLRLCASACQGRICQIYQERAVKIRNLKKL